LVPRIQ